MKHTSEKNTAKSNGKSFCRHMNLDKGSDLDKKMERFIEDCKQIKTINFSRIPKGKIVQMRPKADQARTRAQAFVDAIRYRIVILPGTHDGEPGSMFSGADTPARNFKTEDDWRQFRTIDSKPQRVFEVMQVYDAGMIDRLRRCVSCTNWFYAMRVDRKFCCTKCRRHAFQTSPKQKRAHAEYQKKRYWEGIEKNERLKQIARGEQSTFRVMRPPRAA